MERVPPTAQRTAQFPVGLAPLGPPYRFHRTNRHGSASVVNSTFNTVDLICFLGFFVAVLAGRLPHRAEAGRLGQRLLPRQQSPALVRHRLLDHRRGHQFRAVRRRDGLRLQARHAGGQLGMARLSRAVDPAVDLHPASTCATASRRCRSTSKSVSAARPGRSTPG